MRPTGVSSPSIHAAAAAIGRAMQRSLSGCSQASLVHVMFRPTPFKCMATYLNNGKPPSLRRCNFVCCGGLMSSRCSRIVVCHVSKASAITYPAHNWCHQEWLNIAF